jgi:hypothetical protein
VVVEAGAQGRAKAPLQAVAVERRLLTRLRRLVDRPPVFQGVDLLQTVDLPQLDRKVEAEAEAVLRRRPPTDLRWQHSLTSARAFRGRCRRSRRGAWRC